MLTPEDLLKLAKVYAEACGLSLSTTSRRALGNGNSRTFDRLNEGHGVNSRSSIKAANWFEQNWPASVDWPQDVPREPVVDDPVNHLNAWRQKAKLTQKQVEKTLGWSPSKLSHLERRNVVKNIELLGALASLYGCEANDLLKPPPTGKDAREGKPMRSIEPQPHQKQNSPMTLTQTPDYPDKVRLQLDQVIDLDLAIQILQMLRAADRIDPGNR